MKTRKLFLAYISAMFCLSVLMAIYLVQMTGVYGNSMEPELKDGHSVLVNKAIYNYQEPERFDVVVFKYRYENRTYYIKRVIGLPGETVQIRDGFIYIDGEKLDDPYGFEPLLESGRAAEEIVLGRDEYFVLGDNRNFSSDSRDFDVGNVKRVQILGKAFYKLWPPKPIVYRSIEDESVEKRQAAKGVGSTGADEGV